MLGLLTHITLVYFSVKTVVELTISLRRNDSIRIIHWVAYLFICELLVTFNLLFSATLLPASESYTAMVSVITITIFTASFIPHVFFISYMIKRLIKG